MYRLAILTVSTSGYQGQREDTGSEAIKAILAPPEYEVVRYEIVSDEKDTIAERMAQWSDAPDVDLLVSTGGTGLGPRDVTPEACLSILDKEVPGLAEAMRAEVRSVLAGREVEAAEASLLEIAASLIPGDLPVERTTPAEQPTQPTTADDTVGKAA